MTILNFLLAAVLAFGVAAAFLPALRLAARPRAGVLLVCSSLILLTPLLVPRAVPFVRFLTAVFAFVLCVKLYDLHAAAAEARRRSWVGLLAFLANGAAMVLRRLDAEPRPTARQNRTQLAGGLAGMCAAAAVLTALFRVNWAAVPFVVEHSTKAVAAFCTLLPMGAVSVALWRLGGGRTRDWFAAPLRSRTPADFWRRYNRPVQQFFCEDVFKAAGGWRAPARATLLTFALSGLMHEYVFGVAAGRVQGWQMVFFLIQGAAVAATQRARPKGWRVFPWMIGTFVFNVATSVFFFASVNAILPFYSGTLPLWLRPR
jgi:hypothetical protein